ncbi:MAG: 16S rRNA (guanine(966)-N(2))-methyltransferase RsmD [Brevinematales bacterium]|nr:16S rRNA (guanine(966)-N(2))-methyltransferase RsmD [Brevinematales bacterium]
MLRITGGYLKGRQIVVRSSHVKPTSEVVRQALFNIIDVSGVSFLDIFSGSGIIGIEALSRGANFVCFVDNDYSLMNQLKNNLSILGISKDRYLILEKSWDNAINFLKISNRRFDIIFADPFYNFSNYAKLIYKLKEVSKESSLLIIEHSSRNLIKLDSNVSVIDIKKYGETFLTFVKFAL